MAGRDLFTFGATQAGVAVELNANIQIFANVNGEAFSFVVEQKDKWVGEIGFFTNNVSFDE